MATTQDPAGMRMCTTVVAMMMAGISRHRCARQDVVASGPSMTTPSCVGCTSRPRSRSVRFTVIPNVRQFFLRYFWSKARFKRFSIQRATILCKDNLGIKKIRRGETRFAFILTFVSNVSVLWSDLNLIKKVKILAEAEHPTRFIFRCWI